MRCRVRLPTREPICFVSVDVPPHLQVQPTWTMKSMLSSCLERTVMDSADTGMIGMTPRALSRLGTAPSEAQQIDKPHMMRRKPQGRRPRVSNQRGHPHSSRSRSAAKRGQLQSRSGGQW